MNWREVGDHHYLSDDGPVQVDVKPLFMTASGKIPEGTSWWWEVSPKPHYSSLKISALGDVRNTLESAKRDAEVNAEMLTDKINDKLYRKLTGIQIKKKKK